MKSAIAFWNILLKDMKNYYLKPPNISWGIIFPFAWMLMMFLRTKTAFNIEEVFPGIVGMSILFGTTSMLSVTITFERKARSFERLLLAPISIELLITAKIAGAILFGIFNSIVPVLFSVLYFKAFVSSWAVLITGIILLSIISTLLGLFISVSAKEVFEAQTYSNFFRFPMIFLCGLFIPVSALPLIIRPLSYILPVTYGIDTLHHAISGNGFLPIGIDFIILAVCCFLLFFISIYNIRRRWII
ncbi:MAG: ABC transporter permease [Bacteroidales bacterium]|jgi:ABC-2 type transport system permease protein|nr:ABC transporter permease [Bacteroidales bacterium]